MYSLITAWGRTEMYKNLMTLQQKYRATLFYMDTGMFKLVLFL